MRRWAEEDSWREIARLMDVRLTGGGLKDAKQVIELLSGIGVEGKIERDDKTNEEVETDLVTDEKYGCGRFDTRRGRRVDRARG